VRGLLVVGPVQPSGCSRCYSVAFPERFMGQVDCQVRLLSQEKPSHLVRKEEGLASGTRDLPLGVAVISRVSESGSYDVAGRSLAPFARCKQPKNYPVAECLKAAKNSRPGVVRHYRAIAETLRRVDKPSPKRESRGTEIVAELSWFSLSE